MKRIILLVFSLALLTGITAVTASANGGKGGGDECTTQNARKGGGKGGHGNECPPPPPNNTFCGGNGVTFVATANVGFLNAAAAQGGFYVWDSSNNFNTVLPYTGPLDLQWIMAGSPSTIGSLSSAPKQGVAGVFMPVGAGACLAGPAAKPAQPPHDTWCASKPVPRADQQDGVFLELVKGYMPGDEYKGATISPSLYIQGYGMACSLSEVRNAGLDPANFTLDSSVLAGQGGDIWPVELAGYNKPGGQGAWHPVYRLK